MRFMKKLIALLLIIAAAFSLTACQSPADPPKPDEENPCKNGHSFGDWVVVTETTCEDDGERYRECTVCLFIEEEFTKASPDHHKYSDWRTTLAATCVDEGEKRRTCSVCSNPETEIIPATGAHNYVNYICSVCGGIEEGTPIIPPAPTVPDDCSHEYSTVTYPADCENPGYVLHTCTKCGAFYKSNFVAPLGHTGSTYCTTCGEAILPEDDFED